MVATVIYWLNMYKVVVDKFDIFFTNLDKFVDEMDYCRDEMSHYPCLCDFCKKFANLKRYRDKITQERECYNEAVIAVINSIVSAPEYVLAESCFEINEIIMSSVTTHQLQLYSFMKWFEENKIPSNVEVRDYIRDYVDAVLRESDNEFYHPSDENDGIIYVKLPDDCNVSMFLSDYSDTTAINNARDTIISNLKKHVLKPKNLKEILLKMAIESISKLKTKAVERESE